MTWILIINKRREESLCMILGTHWKKLFSNNHILLCSWKHNSSQNKFLCVALYTNLVSIFDLLIFSLLLKDTCQNQFCFHKICLPEPSQEKQKALKTFNLPRIVCWVNIIHIFNCRQVNVNVYIYCSLEEVYTYAHIHTHTHLYL